MTTLFAGKQFRGRGQVETKSSQTPLLRDQIIFAVGPDGIYRPIVSK